MEEKREERLYIPTNALDRDDYISGFGKKELEIAAAAFALCIVAVIFVVRADEQYMFVSIMAASGVLAVVISLIWRDSYDESLIEKVRQVIVCKREEKKYEYKYYDWILDYVEVEEDVPKDRRK